MIPKNPRKWVVIYSFDHVEYLSQAQYDIFMRAYKEGKVGVSIDGRPYRTNCVTAKLARDYDYPTSLGIFFSFHPEDQYDLIKEKAESFTDKDRDFHWEKFKEGNKYEVFVDEFLKHYELPDIWEKFFGERGGEKK